MLSLFDELCWHRPWGRVEVFHVKHDGVTQYHALQRANLEVTKIGAKTEYTISAQGLQRCLIHERSVTP